MCRPPDGPRRGRGDPGVADAPASAGGVAVVQTDVGSEDVLDRVADILRTIDEFPETVLDLATGNDIFDEGGGGGD